MLYFQNFRDFINFQRQQQLYFPFFGLVKVRFFHKVHEYVWTMQWLGQVSIQALRECKKEYVTFWNKLLSKMYKFQKRKDIVKLASYFESGLWGIGSGTNGKNTEHFATNIKESVSNVKICKFDYEGGQRYGAEKKLFFMFSNYRYYQYNENIMTWIYHRIRRNKRNHKTFR